MRLCDPINEASLRHQTTQLTVKLQHHRTHYDVLRNTNHIVVFTATFYSFSTGCQLRIVRIFKICLSTNCSYSESKMYSSSRVILIVSKLMDFYS